MFFCVEEIIVIVCLILYFIRCFGYYRIILWSKICYDEVIFGFWWLCLLELIDIILKVNCLVDINFILKEKVGKVFFLIF